MCSPQQILVFGVVVCVIASYFWVWAWSNVLQKNQPDLGTLTFGLAFAAGVMMILGINRVMGVSLKTFACVAFALVALNYVGGAMLDVSTKFTRYCIVSAAGWATLAMLSYLWIPKQQ